MDYFRPFIGESLFSIFILFRREWGDNFWRTFCISKRFGKQIGKTANPESYQNGVCKSLLFMAEERVFVLNNFTIIFVGQIANEL